MRDSAAERSGLNTDKEMEKESGFQLIWFGQTKMKGLRREEKRREREEKRAEKRREEEREEKRREEKKREEKRREEERRGEERGGFQQTCFGHLDAVKLIVGVQILPKGVGERARLL